MARVYDFVMTHKLDTDDLFIHTIQRNCAKARLNFFLIEPTWVERFYESFDKGEVWCRVLLNMHSEHHQPDEIFHKLVRLAATKNVQIIDPPDVAQAAFDKARLHPRLIAAGIHVPHTIFVAKDQVPTFKLSQAEREFLGNAFVIKPAMGYGRHGVIMDAKGEEDLKRSAELWPDAHYLLQRRIVPKELNGSPAYFRVFYAFDSIWYTWWNCFTDKYRVVTPTEAIAFGLKPLEEIMRQIAALTGMKFFSSEIALVESGEFIVIDYVNDQCHMLSQSADPQRGVPDELVRAIATKLVRGAKGMIDAQRK